MRRSQSRVAHPSGLRCPGLATQGTGVYPCPGMPKMADGCGTFQHALADGVVRLAPYAAEDAGTIMQWGADLEIQRWFDWPLTPPAEDPTTMADRMAAAARVVEGKRKSWELGREFSFVIHDATGGEGLGWVDVQPLGDGRGNVSYGVLSRHRGQGVATRGVRLLSSYAFEVLGLERLEIKTDAENAASRAVAIKAGYRLEGVLRSYGVFQRHEPWIGRRFDWAIHSRIRADLER